MQRYFSAAFMRVDFPCFRKGSTRLLSARALAIAALSGIAGLTSAANAANDSWSTAPLGNTFSGNNWTVGSTVPGAPTGTIAGGDLLYFGNSNVTLLNNDESSDFAPGGITFNSGASAFVISGNELDLSSSPVTNNSSVLQTISAPIVLNGAQTITTNSGGGNVLLSGNITGGGGITTAGAGTLILSGVDSDNPFPNSFSGTDTLNAGRVVDLNSNSAIGFQSTNNIGAGAVLELRNTTTTAVTMYPTTLNGAGTIQKTGVGLTALGFNSVFGSTNVSLSAGGLIDVEQGQLNGSSSQAGQWGSNQGSLKIALGATFDGAEAAIYVDAVTGSGILQGGYNGNVTTTIGVANGGGTFAGSIQDSKDGGFGTLSLTKTGTGTETLSGDNTFSGNTIVTGGTLILANNLALEQSVLNIPSPGSGSIVWAAGVTSSSLYLGGITGSSDFSLVRNSVTTSLTLDGSFTNSNLSGSLVGGTNLTRAGGGIQTFSGTNTYSGSTSIIEGGILLDYNAHGSGGSPIIPGTSSLALGGTSGFVTHTVSQSYPILQLQGSSAGPVTQTFNGLTLNAGASSQISARGLSGNTATLALGAITHSTGSSVVFTNLGDGTVGSHGVFTTSSTANATTGILGGWATINNAASNSTSIQIPTNYATVSGGTIVPYTTYNIAGQSQTITDNPSSAIVPLTITGGPNQNVDFLLNSGSNATSEFNFPDATTTDVNTILVDSSNTHRLKIDIGSTTGTSTGILRFGVDGGILVAAASTTRPNFGYNSAHSGYITAGGPNNNTPGTLNLQFNNQVDIYGSIIDNGTGAVTVVYNEYSGNQPRIMTSNSYSGGTYINGGRPQLIASQALGTGPVTIGPMGQAYFSANQTYSNNFFISGSAGHNGFAFDTPSAIRFSGNNDTITGNITLLADSTIAGGGASNNLISGQISGNYGLQINENENGASGGSVTLSNPNNNWGGSTVVQSGTLTLAAAGSLPAGNDLTLTGGASLIANSLPVGKALSVGALNIVSSKIDLNNNDLIVHSGSLSAVTLQLQLGFNNGAWNANAGIVSTTAASNTSHLTALGVIVNDNGSGTPLYGTGGTIASTFGGKNSADGDVLVKYTYYGDANLDGKVDGSDYSRIDSGYLAHATGWSNGDFNYDGVVNGSDYTLIDNAFNTQGALIAAQLASPVAQIAGLGTTSAVPEPATVGILGIGAAGVLGRRRRRL